MRIPGENSDIMDIARDNLKRRTAICISCKQERVFKYLRIPKNFLYKCKNCNKLREFFCDYCGFTTNSKRSLKRHVETHLNLSCEVCKAPFTRKIALRVHLRSHFETNICHQCGLNFNNFPAFRRHLKTHDPNFKKKDRKISKLDLFKCNVCRPFYKTETDRNSHEKTHKDDDNFKCTECPKGFFKKEDLRMHQFEHYKGKTYACTFDRCQKLFRGAKNLRLHKQSHLPNKYSCKSCGIVSQNVNFFR